MNLDRYESFKKFAIAELSTGGPDPQLTIMAHLGRTHVIEEKVWLAGCYASCHCVPTAVAVWQRWRALEIVCDDGAALEDWLRENWDYLPVRPEMRSHRMPEKRAECLFDFARYSRIYAMGEMDYHERWADSIKSVKYFGRYMAIKFLELLRRMGDEQLILKDLRAKHAWSPRIALGMIYPEFPQIADRADNTDATLGQTEVVAASLKKKLNHEAVDEALAELSFFQLQVLLCEYRESLVGGYYPGATHDEEMEFCELIGQRFPEARKTVLEARSALFQWRCLGERGGWAGVRPSMKEQWRE